VSADVLACCEAAARREGLSSQLYRQALHELDLPRRYRTILVNGVFGIGGERAQDAEGLRRLHRHLEPGGALVINHYLPWNEGHVWQYMQPELRAKLPEPLPGPWDPRPTSDGSGLRLYARVLAFDPLGPTVTREIVAESVRDGALERREAHILRENLYFPSELVLLLERAGFSEVSLKNDHPKTTFAPDGHVFTLIALR
jgi:hypothetical protein